MTLWGWQCLQIMQILDGEIEFDDFDKEHSELNEVEVSGGNSPVVDQLLEAPSGDSSVALPLAPQSAGQQLP